MTSIVRFYDFVVTDLSDARTQNWPLIHNPFGVLAIIMLYLVIIYKILPAYMENRRPYNLKTIISYYNIFQILACTVLIYGVATSGWTTHYKLFCQLADFSNDKMSIRMASMIWWAMILKIIEFTETVFFSLRKKQNQISFLHVYHHTTSFLAAWLSVKYYPGGMITFTTLVNSMVHVLMYTYYYLSSLGPDMQKKVEPFKSKLTLIQIVQLVAFLIHTLQTLAPSCEMPVAYVIIYGPILLINIFAFLQFYRRAYLQKKKQI